MSIRAVVCRELAPPEKLVIEERDSPEVTGDQVRIDVAACGVNFVDILFVQGLYQIKPEPPFIPGSEVAGTITSVGDGASGYAIGDRVIAMTPLGGFAEQVSVSARSVFPIPDHISFPCAAGIIQSYSTALYALKWRAHLQKGETLLVLGAAGGVGLAAIDIARSMGARVIAAASSQEKRDQCLKAGADAVIDYTKEDLKTRTRELSDGGADVVFDPVGGDYSEPALRALRWGGRFLVIGFAAGKIPRVPLNLALLNTRSILGVDWGAFTVRDRDGNRRLLAELQELLANQKIRPTEPQCYPLERAGEALRDLAERRVVGKAVLTP